MTFTTLFETLLRAEITLWNSLDNALLSDAGVSVPTLQALTAIAERPGAARVQDVSEAMTITVGATSKLVDRLERDGLAERQSNPGDRRSSILVLTDAGRAAQATAATAAEAHLAELLGAFGEKRAAVLAAELSDLTAARS